MRVAVIVDRSGVGRRVVVVVWSWLDWGRVWRRIVGSHDRIWLRICSRLGRRNNWGTVRGRIVNWWEGSGLG